MSIKSLHKVTQAPGSYVKAVQR